VVHEDFQGETATYKGLQGGGWTWILCAQKFNTRYAMFGFNDTANLDEGAMWPVTYALKELTAAEEARISGLVKKAVS
jgi:hypothetical protein